MRAVRIHQFGGPEVLRVEELPRPRPSPGEVLVQVDAAGVGPWDGWVRGGKSALPQPLPLTPGADLSGVVRDFGPGVSDLYVGQAVYGVTNPGFTGAYAEFALARADMIAPRPKHATPLRAAAIPVVAVTAWQMLFDHARVQAGQTVLIHGAAGSVGSHAVQLAKEAGASVIATAFAPDLDYVRSLGADTVIDARNERFEEKCRGLDAVLDTVGGEVLERSFGVLKEGGALISSVARPDPERARQLGLHATFFLVQVTREALERISERVDARRLKTLIGEILTLDQVRLAHEMLAGAPHRKGKIVLQVRAG